MRSDVPPAGSPPEGGIGIAVGKPGAADDFWRANDRDWRSELWSFRVVWHEQSHDVLITAGESLVGALKLHIAASLAHIDALYVLPGYRKRGLGRGALGLAEDVSNYYNCHKVSVAVFAGHPAHAFFERCGYTTEAILPQHTFKLDVAMLRKFLL